MCLIWLNKEKFFGYYVIEKFAIMIISVFTPLQAHKQYNFCINVSEMFKLQHRKVEGEKNDAFFLLWAYFYRVYRFVYIYYSNFMNRQHVNIFVWPNNFYLYQFLQSIFFIVFVLLIMLMLLRFFLLIILCFFARVRAPNKWNTQCKYNKFFSCSFTLIQIQTSDFEFICHIRVRSMGCRCWAFAFHQRIFLWRFYSIFYSRCFFLSASFHRSPLAVPCFVRILFRLKHIFQSINFITDLYQWNKNGRITSAIKAKISIGQNFVHRKWRYFLAKLIFSPASFQRIVLRLKINSISEMWALRNFHFIRSIEMRLNACRTWPIKFREA